MSSLIIVIVSHDLLSPGWFTLPIVSTENQFNHSPKHTYVETPRGTSWPRFELRLVVRQYLSQEEQECLEWSGAHLAQVVPSKIRTEPRISSDDRQNSIDDLRVESSVTEDEVASCIQLIELYGSLSHGENGRILMRIRGSSKGKGVRSAQ
jgi:hypothetical protein